jgi:hypothetical protein
MAQPGSNNGYNNTTSNSYDNLNRKVSYPKKRKENKEKIKRNKKGKRHEGDP